MIELTKGQELALTTDDGRARTRLHVGLGWDRIPTAGAMGTGAPQVDLDASAVQFAGGQLFDLAFYNNLRTRDGSVVHRGDNTTGAGEGDDEVIDVDLARVHGPVDTIVLLVSSYQGHSLTWIDRAYVRLVDEHEQEFARFRITEGVPETGLVMAKLVRDGAGWTLVAIGDGIPVKLPTESVRALQPYL